MAILGSGAIASQLAPPGLTMNTRSWCIRSFLASGGRPFDGLKEALTLKLTKTGTFSNGSVFLSYESMA